MSTKSRTVAVVAVIAAIALYVFIAHGRGIWMPLWLRIVGERSVAEVLKKYGPAARARLKPHFDRARIAYPPKEVSVLVFKRERRMAIWASDGKRWAFIRDYPILAA